MMRCRYGRPRQASAVPPRDPALPLREQWQRISRPCSERVSAGARRCQAHPRARRPGRVRTCRVKEHVVDGGRIGRMARATERKVTEPLSRGASMPGSGHSSHNRGRRERTLVMPPPMDSRSDPSRAGGPRAPRRNRHMSKLNFRRPLTPGSLDEHEERLALLDDVGGEFGRVAAADVFHRVDRFGRYEKDLAGVEGRPLPTVD